MTHTDSIPPKPIPLIVLPKNIPTDLKALYQWLIWNYSWKAELGYWDKPPLDANKSGNAGSSTNPKTWASCEKALSSYQLGNYDGVGIALTQKNGVVGFDLDGCRNPQTGEIAPWAITIVQQVRTYWEISTSGTGLRGIGYGRKPGTRCRTGKFEMYTHGRYLCITGHHLEEIPRTIERVQDAIEAVYAQMFPTQAPHTSSTGDSPHADDDVILNRARAARNTAKFCALYDDGDISIYDGDSSRADQALCRLLAFYTQDVEQVDRLFRRSALSRSKWEQRADYRDWTISKALQYTSEHWQGVSAESSNGQPSHDEGYHRSSTGDEPQEFAPIHLTDRGNALRLVKTYGKDLHYIYRWKKWLVWNGTRWAVDEGNLVEQRAKRVITQLYQEAKMIIDELSQHLDDSVEMGEAARKIREQQINIATATLKWALKSESAERLSGMLKHARSEHGIAITPDELDANPWLLNCANGSIDLQSGTLLPHRREDLCTKQLNIAYDPQATCPYWQAFLMRIMGGPTPDDEGLETALQERYERAERLMKFLQRAVGYSLTGVIREQVLFFMYGGGDNGKSTFSETIAALLGEYYQKAPKELLMQRERHSLGGPSPEIARLCGVRLVIASEVGEHHRLNEAQVKDLTGDDTLTARGLYEAFFQFRPTHKLWMYGNHKPIVQGTDDAIWKRPKLIPFTEKIPPREQIHDLREKYLIPELPGVLTWAVQGCLDWQKDGLQVPDEVNAATAAYRREMDTIEAFLEEHCLMGQDYTVKGADLYARYTQWAESGRETVLRRRKFYDQLRERGCASFTIRSNVMCWRGIGLKTINNSEPDE